MQLLMNHVANNDVTIYFENYGGSCLTYFTVEKTLSSLAQNIVTAQAFNEYSLAVKIRFKFWHTYIPVPSTNSRLFQMRTDL